MSFRLSTRQIPFIGSLVTLVMFATSMRPVPASRQAFGPAALDGALSHIAEQMDRWHATYDVYTDAGAAGNHFNTPAKIANDFSAVEMEPCSTENPHSGLTAIKCTFRNTGSNFGGFLFLNGVLTGTDTEPRANFGDVPDAGVDLRGATRLSFWARSNREGAQVEFFMGGVGRNPQGGSGVAPHPDSAPRVPNIGTVFTLSTNWTAYTIDLTGVDLSYILGGFGWVCSAQNGPQGATFWIDDIQYDKARLDEPRFIQSYVTISNDSFDVSHRNVAFVYDNALALLSLMGRGTDDDWRRAELIAKGFVYAQSHDRTYSDGRLRNAYQAGDLELPPGWAPNGKVGAVRMPTILDCAGARTFEDRIHASSYSGNIAVVAVALLTYQQRRGGQQYLDAARRMAQWIEDRKQSGGLGGYRGGIEGFDRASPAHPTDPVEVPWISLEHNIEIFIAFSKLADATGEGLWRERANHARAFIDKMWESATGCFLVGAKDATNLNKDLLALDAQSLSQLALPDALSRYRSAMDCAERHHRVISDGFIGFDYNDDRDGVWFEGSAQMSLAYARAGESAKSAEMISELRRAQSSARNTNGHGIIAASRDGVTTGFQQEGNAVALYSRLHVGTTAMYALAEVGRDFYFLFGSDPRITGVSKKGKKLFVMGERFTEGSEILINGIQQKKTSNDPETPSIRLVDKKAGKLIAPGDKVKVRNSDGDESNEFIYTP